VKILVVGSFMMDLVVRTPRAPENGETIIGTSFSRFPGGKGANQAVAAARLGGQVTLVGKLGPDPFGDEMLATVDKEKINTEYILRDHHHPTGIGTIMLDQYGNNRIIVVPGANSQYKTIDLDNVEKVIKESSILLLQLEMDIEMIERAVHYAYVYHVPVILNPAPAQKLSDKILSRVTYLTPNETEAEILTGTKINGIEDAKGAVKVLLAKGVNNIVMTLAEKGALIASPFGIKHVPGYTVKPVDTVAAGDAFNGALAVAVVSGKSLEEAVRFSNAAGALAVTKEGAIPSLPYLKEVQNFIEGQEGIA
jgi:ribokinase